MGRSSGWRATPVAPGLGCVLSLWLQEQRDRMKAGLAGRRDDPGRSQDEAPEEAPVQEAAEGQGFRRALPGVEGARRFHLDDAAGVQAGFDEEPSRVNAEDFRALLLSCVMTGASDVTVQTGRQVRAEIEGRLHVVTRRALGTSEVDDILTESYGGPARGAHARAAVNSREVLDYSYELVLADGSRQRFRCNATGIHAVGGAGVEITFRALPTRTPDLGWVELGGPLLEAMMPREGLVVFAGATGHGKTTTLAAVVRQHLESVVRPVKIVDVQQPIEFTFEDIWGRPGSKALPSTIGQSEVGRQVKTFGAGVWSALRRKPHVIVVGEARDQDTIAASLEASVTGHLVYTTTHAGSVPDVIRRLLSVFRAEERDARANQLAAALRVIVVQVLVPGVSGGRVPVREYLIVSEGLRERMMSASTDDWAGIVVEEMGKPRDEERRESLVSHAARLFGEGRISGADRRRLSRVGAV